MAKEIVNRVAQSKLVTIDLQDFYPEEKRVVLDISEWLYQGLVIREKEFRATLKDYDWQQYTHCFVALSCSTEAIIPSWAYLLITSYLAPNTQKVIVGNLDTLEVSIFQDVINGLDFTLYRDRPVIIKGCSEKHIPETAFVQLIEKLQPVAKSILFGEACSTVPLYKRKKEA